MIYKVLVVEDSSFFRRRVTDILNKDINLEVIGFAINGKEAVEKAIALKPDVITMDIEMPILNGIEAVKQIMVQAPTAILMFSSLTHKGAKATLDALQAGALDFLPKKFDEIASNSELAGSVLRQRVLQLARRGKQLSKACSPKVISSSVEVTPQKSTPVVDHKYQHKSLASFRSTGKNYKLLAIGTSTGGPVALQKVLSALPHDFPMPIILIQHMPAAFTQAFASRLNSLCKITVKEAVNGELVKPGVAYLAPGGRQMIIDGTENAPKIKVLDDNSPRIAYKPSVDISFGSAAKIYAGAVLGVILTGMGADGREGSRMLKSKGATIWAQDEESCVVYGMPQAVAVAGISQLSLPLVDISQAILKEVRYG